MNRIVFVGEHPKSFGVRWHTHPTWELVYCTSGQGAFCFPEGKTLAYRAGELVVIPPKLAHTNSSEEGFTNIYMNMQALTLPGGDAFKVTDGDGALLQTLTQARAYYAGGKAGKELVLSALGELTVSYLTVLRGNTEYSEQVERIRREILEKHLNPDFALDDFIRRLPFHYDYLRKLFKKEMGLSPLEYMTGLRMKNAERLLTSLDPNSRAISEVAHMCGYDNALYFSRVFKKYHGCSPTQFMSRQNRAGAACGE